MESITKCLAANVRALRKRKNLTQTELAMKAGISLIFLQGIETERKWVSPQTAQALAQALNVTESKLFENCFEKKSAHRRATKANVRLGKKSQDLAHLPDDIYLALSTTCRHAKWKWEFFRWIVSGYEQEYFS